jgi:hypothetical protein
MNRSRRFLPPSVLAVTLSPVIFGSHALQSTALQTSPTECHVTVSGKDTPDQVLAQDVWEATFRRLSANPSAAVLAGIGGPSALRLAASGTSALARANALRQSLPTAPTAGLPRQVSQDRELVIADYILDARDSELRELSIDQFEQLTDYALETARTLDVILPIPGRIVSDDLGHRYCEVKVKGQDHPHLLPEHIVWSQMFKMLPAMIEFQIGPIGGLTDEHLLRLSRHLQMPIDDIRVFLRVARDTTTKEQELRAAQAGATAEQQEQVESRVLRTVMTGRHAILRSINPDSWRALMKYVDVFRAGVGSWYRSPLSK